MRCGAGGRAAPGQSAVVCDRQSGEIARARPDVDCGKRSAVLLEARRAPIPGEQDDEADKPVAVACAKDATGRRVVRIDST